MKIIDIIKNLKSLKFILAILWFVLAIWTELHWFFLLSFLAITSFFIQKNRFYQALRQKFIYKIYKSVKAVALIFALSLVIRCFFLEIFGIPSGSMEKTLLPGDKILVEKLSLGPDRPCSLLEIPNLGALLSLSEVTTRFSKNHTVPQKRLAGLRDVEHNDVLVFQNPLNSKLHFIKRFVGLPGDTFLIQEGRVRINEQELFPNAKAVFQWDLFSKNLRLINPLLDSMNIVPSFVHRETERDLYTVGMTKADAEKLQVTRALDSVRLHLQKPEKGRKTIFPKSNEIEKSIDYWGPVVIPYKGMKIAMNKENYTWYRRAIQRHEGHKLIMKKNNRFYLDGQPCREYTFEQNHYMAIGDNRNNSRDSRYWGFVPEKNIVGKARLIIASNDPYKDGWESFRVDRFFKKIR